MVQFSLKTVFFLSLLLYCQKLNLNFLISLLADFLVVNYLIVSDVGDPVLQIFLVLQQLLNYT